MSERPAPEVLPVVKRVVTSRRSWDERPLKKRLPLVLTNMDNQEGKRGSGKRKVMLGELLQIEKLSADRYVQCQEVPCLKQG